MSTTRLLPYHSPAQPQQQSPLQARCSTLLLLVIPIAQIAMGARYLDDCPRQHNIPVYLIVTGVFFIMRLLLPEDGFCDLPNRFFTVCNTFLTLFLFGWFIAGNVWIYSIYQPNYNKNTTNVDPYCDRTLYQFAVWITVLVNVLIGLFLVCCRCGRA